MLVPDFFWKFEFFSNERVGAIEIIKMKKNAKLTEKSKLDLKHVK